MKKEINFKKAVNILNNLSPVATKIQIRNEMVDSLLSSISICDYNKPQSTEGYVNNYTGVELLGVDDKELNIKQGRVFYTDGSSKIIDIFE